MDISLLKCFLTVSECLNFSGAAERLFITQSTVSRRIAALESELNVKLFERNASGVSLTEAGKACVSDAREIVRKYEDMREKTQRYHSGVSGTLRVFCDGEHDRDLIAEACAEIRKTYPDIRIHIMRGCSGPAVEQLVQGEADIILAVTSELYNVKNLVEIPIKPMHWVMVLPAAHPLAKKRVADVTDLKNNVVIGFERSVAPRAYDAVMRCCAKHHFSPCYTVAESNKEDMLLAMLSHNGVAVMASGCAEGLPDHFAILPIHGIDVEVNYALAYMKNNTNPSLLLFADILLTIARRQQIKGLPSLSS
ncbi:MAG: LysR family transcriptional regulator [Christensenellales bacterium]|jgi:DNA-binding transcriptional LysR family regulator